jgi:hypothetical protein
MPVASLSMTTNCLRYSFRSQTATVVCGFPFFTCARTKTTVATSELKIPGAVLLTKGNAAALVMLCSRGRIPALQEPAQHKCEHSIIKDPFAAPVTLVRCFLTKKGLPTG